jgi:hypothetical protein
VNKPADGVRRHHSNCPKQHQKDGNGPQHGTSPFLSKKPRSGNTDVPGHFHDTSRSFEKLSTSEGSTSGAAAAEPLNEERICVVFERYSRNRRVRQWLPSSLLWHWESISAGPDSFLIVTDRE